MRVGDIVPEARGLSTYVTYGRHSGEPYQMRDSVPDGHYPWPMAEVVQAPPKGLELFASRRRQKALEVTGRRAKGLEKLKVETVQDLLQHYPRRHVDRTQLRTIRELATMSAEERGPGEVQVLARVEQIARPFRTRTGKSSSRGASATRRGRSRSPGSTSSGSPARSSRAPRPSSTASSIPFAASYR
jgi:hypothetical protein